MQWTDACAAARQCAGAGCASKCFVIQGCCGIVDAWRDVERGYALQRAFEGITGLQWCWIGNGTVSVVDGLEESTGPVIGVGEWLYSVVRAGVRHLFLSYFSVSDEAACWVVQVLAQRARRTKCSVGFAFSSITNITLAAIRDSRKAFRRVDLRGCLLVTDLHGLLEVMRDVDVVLCDTLKRRVDAYLLAT